MMMSACLIATFVLARIMASSVCPASPRNEASAALRSARSPTLTATTRAAPMSLTTSAGTLSTVPPSTSTIPSRRTGGKISGSDIVARIAEASEPRSSTTRVALSRSIDTVRNGVGRSSNVRAA